MSVPALERSYFDTNVFIYALEGDPVFTQAAVALLEAAGGRAVTSEYAIAECIIGKSETVDDILLQEDYVAYFADPDNIETVAVSRELLIHAARLARGLGMKLADSIHVATAIASGCQSFVTNDRKLGLRLPESLRYVPLRATPPAGS